jgi:hypothetical protein
MTFMPIARATCVVELRDIRANIPVDKARIFQKFQWKGAVLLFFGGGGAERKAYCEVAKHTFINWGIFFRRVHKTAKNYF